MCSFLTDDKIYTYISNMVNNLTAYSIALGYKNVFYITPYFKYVEKKDIDIDDIDKLFGYNNISNCQKSKTYKIFSNYD